MRVCVFVVLQTLPQQQQKKNKNKKKLYGRGGADDGYSTFGSVDAIRALQEQGLPHPRCVIVIEGSEESGSCDLDFYLDKLKSRIGTPSLVICLDSGVYSVLYSYV